MKHLTSILVAAFGFSMAADAAACSSEFKPAQTFDLVVDGKAHFTTATDMQIEVKRTIRGPRVKQVIVPDAAMAEDEIWIVCAPSPYLFGTERYPRGRDYEGRFFLKLERDGPYRISNFVERKKG